MPHLEQTVSWLSAEVECASSCSLHLAPNAQVRSQRLTTLLTPRVSGSRIPILAILAESESASGLH
jgi:hypothetical protein